jgi:hypothetical protein
MHLGVLRLGAGPAPFARWSGCVPYAFVALSRTPNPNVLMEAAWL